MFSQVGDETTATAHLEANNHNPIAAPQGALAMGYIENRVVLKRSGPC